VEPVGIVRRRVGSRFVKATRKLNGSFYLLPAGVIAQYVAFSLEFSQHVFETT